MRITHRWAFHLFLALWVAALVALRLLFPERGLYQTGPRALLDSLFALSLAAWVLMIAAGIGYGILRRVLGDGLTGLEAVIFSLALGLGVLAYGVLALGLAGWLTPLNIGLWLLAAGLIVWRDVSWMPGQLKTLGRKLREELASQPAIFKTGACLGASILFLALLNCLAPPSDYDGLMYHLRAPQLFLEAHKLMILDGFWQANGPSTIDMLFTAGLAFGSDSFAQLIHFALFLLFLAAGFGFYRNFISREGGLVTVLVLLGIPVLAFIASRSHTDFGWGLFEFLAVWALANWLHERQTSWLAVSGAMLGLAMGTKYLAMGATALLGLWVLWEGRRRPSAAFRDLLHFALPAVLVASPWYLKNWVLGGNPFYPFLFPTPGWDAARSQLLGSYLESFGTGRSFLDFLALPLNLYVQHVRYASFISIDAPGFLFPIALLYLFRRDDSLLNRLGLYSLAWFAVWSLGSQQARFLIPVYPIWAMLTAHLLLSLRSPLLRRGLAGGLCAAMLLITLIYQADDLMEKPLFGVLLGSRSKAAYLEKAVSGFQALEFARRELPPGSRVLMIWDGRSYYCGSLCVPDTEEDIWLRLTSTGETPETLTAALRGMGFTHLMVTDPAWHLLHHDPGGLHRAAYTRLQNDYLPTCALPVYQSGVSTLYELRCSSSE